MIGSQNGGSEHLPTIQDRVKLDSPEEGIPCVCLALLPGWGEFSVDAVKVKTTFLFSVRRFLLLGECGRRRDFELGVQSGIVEWKSTSVGSSLR